MDGFSLEMIMGLQMGTREKEKEGGNDLQT